MRRALRRLSRYLLRGVLSLAVGAAALIAYLATTTEVERARFERPRDAVTITDRHGTPLRHERSDGRDRRWVSLDQVSPHLVDAVLAVEDQRFHSHGGVDLRATARAGLSFALPGRRVSGASTITQQLIKLTHGRPDGLWDKPREILRAVMLERERDKDWILEQYLNRLPYGDQVVGVARASELYFGKPVSRLSVAEAALLAGIPQAPSALDPRRHLPAALRRRAVVLRRMRDTGRIDEATFLSASAEPAAIRARPVRPWRAPRFADAALEGWRDGSLSRSGQTLRTSLDLPLQREAERILRDAVERLEERGVTNGAAVVVSNQSGEVLAHVGAARGGESPGGWLDLARARRQPGSTLKPFVYELFFERGGTPASLLDDLSRPMVGGGGALFTARDYDGRERGPVRAREALSASLNLAALDAARQVGAERVVARLGELGVRELDGADRYGAAIVLGGADVTAFELAEAYVTLARGGTRVPLSLGRAAPEPRPVMDPAHAALTRDVLMDARARREAFGEAGRLMRDARAQLRSAETLLLARHPIVCATAAGADAALLRKTHFDHVVLDEATQATDPIALVALWRAARVTMAGDPRQLPPTVIDPDAERGGLGTTFFERLSDEGSATTMLEVQHRMHEVLMRFPSEQLYEGKLRAHEAVAQHGLGDLGVADDPLRPGPLVFLDTAGKGWTERRAVDDPSIDNPGAAARVIAEARRLLSRGLADADLAIITPYLAQARLLRDGLSDRLTEGLEIGTVDGFQGREKEAVIVDLVRSNEDAEIGFLADVRRMNVAMTRAKRLL
ncbi:MAG TPA: hypothetical protein DEF51_12645, partial [Myxococcales bacterium]|nr:hypothetical protein [Myxococcales bacterium]